MLAVTIWKGRIGLDPERMNATDLETIQIKEAEEMIGLNVVSVEKNPKHPAYEAACARMLSRVGPAIQSS